MNQYKLFLAFILAVLCSCTSSWATEAVPSRNVKAVQFMYQNEPQQAIDVLKQQVNEQGFIHQHAWIVPSIIANQKQTYYPKTFGLKHPNIHIQQALDLLKVKQLLLAKDSALAEKLYQNMSSDPALSTTIFYEATLAFIDHYLTRMPNISKAEFYLSMATVITKDPVFYPEIKYRKIKILIAKKQYEAALTNYGQLITDYPNMDPKQALFQQINQAMGGLVAFNDCFKNNEDRYRFLLNCFEQGHHELLQNYGYYLLRHSYQYTAILIDVRSIVALSLYITCDYDAALGLFNEITRRPFQFEHHHLARLYMAKCFDEIGQSENSLKVLQKLLKSKFLSQHIRSQALYDACIIAKKINLDDVFFDYKTQLQKSKGSSFFLNQLQWEQQWDLYSFSKKEDAIINGLKQQLRTKELKEQVIQIYREIQQDYQFESLSQAFAYMPLSYSDYYYLKNLKAPDENLPMKYKIWMDSGFKDIAIKQWRFNQAQNNQKDHWYSLFRSEREVNAFLNITKQNTVFCYKLDNIPAIFRKERYPFNHYYSINQEKDNIDPFIGLALNHQESKQYFNAFYNETYLNPDPSQLLRWAYEIDVELDDIQTLSTTDIKNVAYGYIKYLNQHFNLPHLMLIALKENMQEANRVKMFNSQSFKQSEQLIDDSNTAFFVNSVLQKTVVYRFLTSWM